MKEANQRAIAWLEAADEPAVRYLARRDLLGRDSARDRALIPTGRRVKALLSGQRPDGTFGVHAYRKWQGAHWRLVSLVELGVGGDQPGMIQAADTVLAWLTGDGHRRGIRHQNGRTYRCASQEGNALAVASRLGMADDHRVGGLAHSLIEWQWADGGWNCDLRASGRRSSFHESLPAAWGLSEYAAATGDEEALAAAQRTAELLLDHRLFRSLATGEVIHRSFVTLHYPPYWHYDFLQALLVLSRLGLATDSRSADALDLLERRRRPDGLWQPGAYWWHPPGAGQSNEEVVDWGRSQPSEMLTLNSLRVLKAAGRW